MISDDDRRVLMALEGHGRRGASLFDLADKLDVIASWVLDHLRRLELDGHVVRTERGWLLKSNWCRALGHRLPPLGLANEVPIPTIMPKASPELV